MGADDRLHALVDAIPESLRSVEYRLQRFLEYTDEMIALVDPAGTIVYTSPATNRFLGYPDALLAGKPAWIFIHPDDRTRVERTLAALAPDGEPVVGEARFLHHDGSWRRLRGTLRNLVDDQAIGAILINYRDITDAPPAESPATHRTTLERPLSEQDKYDALARLAGGVAHDFSNLLTAILGFAELLAADLADDDRRLADVSEIGRAATNATILTKRLLAFCGMQSTEPARLNLNRAVHNTESMLRRLMGEGIDLRVRTDPHLHEIWADGSQIEQAVVNLAVNARDAMPDGGRLIIETRNVELTRDDAGSHAATTPGTYVRLTVSDTGRGMSPEEQARMFEPFFTTKGSGHGIGLGLSTVYGFVRQNGGHIHVSSEPLRGTTLHLDFPRLDDLQTPRGAATPPPADDPGRDALVLVVEDSSQVRQLAVRALAKHGYRVLEAENADQALALAMAADPPIDLLITDIVLPGRNGCELAAELRRAQPALKCLFMSGYTGDAIARDLAAEDDLSFLQKPFTPDMLVSHARHALRAGKR